METDALNIYNILGIKDEATVEEIQKKI